MSTRLLKSPPPSCTPTHVYPSPRSKSPPPATHRPIRCLPALSFPLSDFTSFSLTQAASELTSESIPPPLRSPIPLFTQPPHSAAFSFRSPIFEPPPAVEPPSSIMFDSSRSPCRGAEHPRKRRRRASSALRSPPPSPRKYTKRSPPIPSRPAPAPPLPASFPSPPPPPPLLSFPRQKRTKRELAELQWQVLLHRSLAWSVRMRRTEDFPRGEDGPLSALNLERGGLMIAFSASPRAETGHWTDVLDRDLVRRVWEQLLRQGCRPVGVVAQVSRARPTPATPSTPCVPFPALAPPIELESPDNFVAPRRARVSALSSPARASNSPIPPITRELPESPDTREFQGCERKLPTPPSYVEFPMPPPTISTKATLPKGTLGPRQLVAQLMLRRSLGRARPIRRGPGGASLHREPMRSRLVEE